MSLGFGNLARIGQLYPSGGLVDYEPQLMAPAGVQFLTTRLPFRSASLESDRRLADALEEHVQLLADAQVDLIVFNCTAASLVIGPQVINARIHAATGIRSITTIEAVLAALAAVGAKRIALVTPYMAEVVAEEVAFLARFGFTVVAEKGRPCTNPIEQGELDPQGWIEIAASLNGCGADAMLLSCAGVQIAPVLPALERAFGGPVVTSNQALVWHALRTLNIKARPAEYGALLAGAFDHDAGLRAAG